MSSRTRIGGDQIKDGSVTEEDIGTGAVKVDELSSEVISEQAEITEVDVTNDRLLILDNTDGSLKKVAPENVSSGGSVSGALTTVTSIANDSLTLGRSDQQDMLDFSTDDRINFKVDNVERFAITNNNRVQIGSSAAPAGSTVPALIIGKNNGTTQGTALFAKTTSSTYNFRTDSDGSKGQPGISVASGDGAEYAGIQAHSLYLEGTGAGSANGYTLFSNGGIQTSGNLEVLGSIINGDVAMNTAVSNALLTARDVSGGDPAIFVQELINQLNLL